jgi:hypothetical protein
LQRFAHWLDAAQMRPLMERKRYVGCRVGAQVNQANPPLFAGFND